MRREINFTALVQKCAGSFLRIPTSKEHLQQGRQKFQFSHLARPQDAKIAKELQFTMLPQ